MPKIAFPKGSLGIVPGELDEPTLGAELGFESGERAPLAALVAEGLGARGALSGSDGSTEVPALFVLVLLVLEGSASFEGSLVMGRALAGMLGWPPSGASLGRLWGSQEGGTSDQAEGDKDGTAYGVLGASSSML